MKVAGHARRSSVPVPSFGDLHAPDGNNSLDLILLVGADLLAHDAPEADESSAGTRPRPHASLEATVARQGFLRRRGSASQEAALAIVVRPLLLRWRPVLISPSC